MDLIQENYCGDHQDDDSPEESVSPEISEMCDIFGEPEILPRVGDEYQVDIPPRSSDEAINDFHIELHIPLIWIKDENEIVNHKNEYPTETAVSSEGEELKAQVKKSDMKMKNGTNSSDMKDSALQVEINGKGCCLVPGSLSASWCDLEEANFLLGLYIFGKNLVQVRKFVGNKEMGDILSFYYGKFYQSEKYRRWAGCRKMRGRKCVYGQRLFTGWRLQELLSRLLPNLSEENQNNLLEAAKAFGEGKILLEEYVHSLKAVVGLNALVQAFGIGKGKKDLTGIVMETLKSSQVVPVRLEIPVGKACSALTPFEIVNFLTGDFRLSKARSSDLFWEAVWPRLLARGWHSEQPDDNGYSLSSKQPSLVFLIPGIKKFSRRKLVKGNHYYDSVSDVLKKVASDPELLELENSKEENGWNENDIKPDHEVGSPDSRRHSYLKPRTPTRTVDGMKFTVVDTSLANGKAFKVRELRSLPVEITSAFKSSHSNDIDPESSKESMDDSYSDDTLCYYKEETNDTSKATGTNSLDQQAVVSLQGEVFVDGDSNCLVEGSDSTKQIQSLNGCGCLEIQLGKRTKPAPDRVIFYEDVTSQTVGPCQEKSFSSSSRGSTITSCDSILNSTCVVSEEKNQARSLFDLNLPVPSDAENFEHSAMGMREKQHDGKMVKTFESVGISEQQQQPMIASRRQSNRNRPPTMKALEALALGLLDVKQKRKSRDPFSDEYSLLRPSQRARAKVRRTEKFANSIVDFKAEERESHVGNGNSDVFHKLEV